MKRTKNRDYRRRNTKKRNTKKRNIKKRKTKKNMRGGMRGLQCLGCGPPVVAEIATAREPITHSLVDKFYEVISIEGDPQEDTNIN